MTEATASPMESNAHTPAEISSGMPRSRSVASVITPSVPSEPTNSLVRSQATMSTLERCARPDDVVE